MQDKTISHALLALYRQGGDQAIAASIILIMRGIELPNCSHDRPLSRGRCKRLVIGALSHGPRTSAQVGEAISAHVGGLSSRSATNRAYQALLRLEDKGVVVRDFGPDGCLWRLA